MMNLSLSCVENEYYRNLSKHYYRFRRRYVKKILFLVPENVERRMSPEMNSTKRIFMHDEWTFGGDATALDYLLSTPKSHRLCAVSMLYCN